jgi:site-specific recombinase XerD
VKTPRLSPRDFDGVLSSYVAARRGEGLAEGTLVYRRLYLAHFLSWLKAEGVDDLRRVRPEEMHRYAVALARHRYRTGPAAVRRRRSGSCRRRP